MDDTAREGRGGLIAWLKNMVSLHKPGQGMWTRGLGALGIMAMGIYGAMQTAQWMTAYRLTGLLKVGGMSIPYYYGFGAYVPAIIFLVFLTLAYVAANTGRAADLLIETEIEMRKVTWPTPKEVAGATMVVIVVVLILGSYLFGLDKIFENTLLRWLGFTPGGL